LVDLHIYVVPAYLWHDRLRSAFNQAYCPEIFVLDSEVARRSQTSSNGSMASNRSNNTEQSTVYHGKVPQVTQKGGTGVYIGPYPMQSYPGLSSRPGTAGSQGQHDSGLDLDDDESERRAEDEERRRREEEERRRREEEERLRRLAEEEERRRREREDENAANSLIPNLLIEEATMIHDQEPEDPQEKLRREREELLQLLQKIRDDRLEIERRREDLMRRAKQLQSRMQNLRNQARDMWKKRYFEAKKQTVPLEEQTNKLREELEAYHKRMVGTMTSRVKEGRNVDAPDATQQ
uniref:SPATA1_C domain-containing protein n=1 Tax=Macrostomum lignano TaxID=282301 RepID=A0A1I8GY28_9PLAT